MKKFEYTGARPHHGPKGLVRKGDVIELTDRQAACLVNKIRPIQAPAKKSAAKSK